MMPIPPERVIVALSGGVDSSVAAALLKEGGWEIQTVHFTIPAPLEVTERKREEAEQAAACLSVPLRVVDLRERFETEVIEPFLRSYASGLTPNPCVACNPRVKFRTLLEVADSIGAHWVSTGHYARIISNADGLKVLFRGRDRGKDQSYFLHRLDLGALPRIVFPLGDLTKAEVRGMARQRGLPARSSAESQEICFIPGGDYRAFLRERAGDGLDRPGDIVDAGGKKLGRHSGTYRFTIGQRRGLGIASGRPYYVTELRPEANLVIVGRKEDLYHRSVLAEEFYCHEGNLEGSPVEAEAQIRYRHKPAPGLLFKLPGGRVRFEFKDAQPAVTPGQALVCYTGERVLGGGWIAGHGGW